MPVAPDAILQDQEGRAVLRFERKLAHPPERVWRALTERGELTGWHPTPFEIEPEAGGPCGTSRCRRPPTPLRCPTAR